MKRLIKLLLALVLALTVFQISFVQAQAAEVASGICGNSLTWVLDDSGKLTISGTGTMWSHDYSSDVPWYEYRDQIQEVVLENGVTSIGEYAFYYCSSLESITLPESVTSIGYGAFMDCSSLVSITLPESVTSIGSYAFEGCSSLVSITIPESVTSIGSSAFPECSSLVSITIPESVTSIGSGTFYDCSSLKSITIPGSVTSIGYWAFYGCSSLKSITIPEGVTSIDISTFCGCSSLESITIPEGVTSIDGGAFWDCSSLKSITLPESVTSIGEFAFYDCSSLVNITIPEGVTSIGSYAFEGCSSLAEVRIADISKWCQIDFSEASSNPMHTGAKLYVNGELVTNLVIPDGVTSIGYDAFNGCRSLVSITIPKTVTSIGEGAFADCSSLKSITIPEGVTSIGENAFAGCSSLESITIPESVTSISSSAFYDCSSLKNITILEGVTSIGNWAFEGCKNLTEVRIADIAKWCQIDFSEASSNPMHTGANLYVNGELVTNLVIPDGVNSINKYAFLDCTSLESITIPEGVTSIGNGAFLGCSSLESITIPEGVTSIGISAFLDCFSLESVTIPKTVTSIGSSAFCYCTSLESVTIPEGVTSIGDYVFSYCGRLESVTIPKTVTSIGSSAFDFCDNLEEVYYGGTRSQWENLSNRPSVVYMHYSVTDTANHWQSLVTAPACTTEGYTKHSCACGHSYKDNHTAALDHDLGQWETTKEASCTEEGSKRRDCSRCDHFETDVIAITPHSYTEMVTAPTCTTEGYTTYTCSCEDSYKDNHTAALDHDLGQWETTKEATCTEEGSMRRDCSRCDHFETDVIAMIPHSYTKTVTAPTCTAKGYTKHSCSCGYSYKNNYTNALGHKYWNGKCKVCDKVNPNFVSLALIAQPESVAATKGATAKVTVKAVGNGLTYKWYYKDKGASNYTLASSKTATFSTTMTAAKNGRKVYCKVTDKYGNTVQSNTVTLTLKQTAKITTQPKNVLAEKGATVKFTVKATGDGLTYKWYYKNKSATKYSVASTTSNTFSTTMDSSKDGRKVYCVVKDKYGNTVQSNTVTLTLKQTAKITTQPKNVLAEKGATVKFTVKATGDGLTYKWYYKNKSATKYSVASTTSNTFSTTMDSSKDGRKVYCVVKDKYGNTVQSTTATLTLKQTAKITTQPKSVTVSKGATAKVTVKATGDGLTYKWYYKDKGASKYTLASSKTSAFSCAMTSAKNGRQIYCKVTDKYGNTVKSNVVTLKMK